MTACHAHPDLAGTLRRLRRRWLAIGMGSSCAWVSVAAAAGLAVGGWIDLVFDLSPMLRIVVPAVTGLSAAGLLMVLIMRVRCAARSDVLAQRLDRAGQTGGQIRSGADLQRSRECREEGGQSPASSAPASIEGGCSHPNALTGGLIQMAIDRAALLADGVAAGEVVALRPLLGAMAGVVGVAAIGCMVVLLAPSMALTEYLRFTDPFGDHPPYSRTSFSVHPGDARVIYGAHQEIRVVTSGPVVAGLDLVLLAADAPVSSSVREEVLPMFGEPGGVWRATLTGITAPTQYLVRAREGRSHRFRLGVITTPRIESVRVRVIPPGYTQRSAYEGPVPAAGLAGLPGTRVQVWATSNRPLAGGRMEVHPAGSSPTPAGSISMTAVARGAAEVTGGFEVRVPGRIEIRVRDAEGQDSQDTFATSLALLADERPFVRLLEPPAMALATPEAALPVALAAEDDYGIARVELYRSLNNSRAWPVDVALTSGQPSRQNHATALPMSAYALRPGDEIRLFARVEDNDPAGTKGAESPMASVRIISQEEFERLVLTRRGLQVLQSKYQQAQRRMEQIAGEVKALQQELSGLPADAPVSREMRKKLADLTARMRQQAGEMQQMAAAPLPFDLDHRLSRHLLELTEMLARAADESAPLSEETPAATHAEAGHKLEQLARELEDARRQYGQETLEPLDRLAQVFPLMRDEARFVALYRRQKDLADRLGSLAGKERIDDPSLAARLRDLEGEQYRIREDLENLMHDVEAHVAQLPADAPELRDLRETATAFARGVQDSGAAAAMTEAQAALAAASGTQAAEHAREAEQILSRFLSQCSSMGGAAGTCLKFAPGLGDELGNTVEQLLAGAGSKPGPTGMGLTGGGFSAEASTLDNIGLFGQLPALGGGMLDSESSGGGSAASARGGREGNFEAAQAGRVDPLEALRAAGAGQNVVPLEYRERVGAYFQRLTDEAGTQPEGR